MRKWAPVLHFYQPPTQDPHITTEIYGTSYKPFLDLLLEHPEIRLTLNVTGALIVQLHTLGVTEFFDKLKILLDKKQIELVNSPLYHPLLPLIDGDVILRQLLYNRNIIQHYLGIETMRGVFPPELAIDEKTLETVMKEYDFCLVDESSVSSNFNHNVVLEKPFYQYQDLLLVASSRAITEVLRAYPREIEGGEFIQFFLKNTKEDQTVVSVNDVELFGHHYAHRFELLKSVFESKEITLCQLSDLLSPSDKETSSVQTINKSTWVTTQDDLAENNPFPLWQKENNILQKLYTELSVLAYTHLQNTPKPNEDNELTYQAATNHYDVGISSCHLYWLSNWPWWHPDLVEKGAENLIRAIRSLPLTPQQKIGAEGLYAKFKYELWKYHWEGNQFEMYARYDQYREKFLHTLPQLEQLS